jgi:hypothetical protein
MGGRLSRVVVEQWKCGWDLHMVGSGKRLRKMCGYEDLGVLALGGTLCFHVRYKGGYLFEGNS